MRFKLDRECVYEEVEYVVVDVLQNDLLLVVSKENWNSKKFPLITSVIPDAMVYGK